MRVAYLLDLNRRFGHHIFLAGLVGFLIGILFSVTVWATNRVIQTKLQLNQETSLIGNIFGTNLSLDLKTPAENTTVSQSSVTISGSTSTKATVLITGGASDIAVDSDGSFSTTYQLVEGANELLISAIDANGREASTERSIFYTTESLE